MPNHIDMRLRMQDHHGVSQCYAATPLRRYALASHASPESPGWPWSGVSRLAMAGQRGAPGIHHHTTEMLTFGSAKDQPAFKVVVDNRPLAAPRGVEGAKGPNLVEGWRMARHGPSPGWKVGWLSSPAWYYRKWSGEWPDIARDVRNDHKLRDLWMTFFVNFGRFLIGLIDYIHWPVEIDAVTTFMPLTRAHWRLKGAADHLSR